MIILEYEYCQVFQYLYWFQELITEEENGIEAAAADAASNQVSSVSGSDSKKKKRKEDKSYGKLKQFLADF